MSRARETGPPVERSVGRLRATARAASQRATWRRCAWACALALVVACGSEGGDTSDDGRAADVVSSAAETSVAPSAARGADAPSLPAPPRHVVVVVFEALRADHVGALGYPRRTTPVLDALAADGVLYERAHAASSLVSQSLSALWTGRLPSSGGATGLAEAEPHPSLPSLPRLFRAAGWRTGFVGNHQALWQRGFTRGFDELEVDSVPGRWLAPDVTDRALDVVDGWLTAEARADGAAAGPLAGLRGFVAADAAAEPAAREPPRSGDAPDDPAPAGSLLVVDYADAREPHLPLRAARVLMADAPVPQQALSLDAVRAAAGALPDDFADSVGFRDLVARYDAELAMVDDQLGVLLAGLAARGRLDDTLLVVTSSHGVEFLEHGYVGSGWSLHDEVLRVPLVLHAPGWLAPARVSEPVSLVDVLPTLAGLHGLHGRDVRYDGLPLLERTFDGLRPRARGGDVLAELVIPELSTVRAVIRGEHKLVRTLTGFAPGERLELALQYQQRVAAMQDGELQRPDPWGAARTTQLFDLSVDPGERVDRARERADVVERLAEVLARYGAFCRDNAPAAREAARAQQPVEGAETLQQLGYL